MIIRPLIVLRFIYLSIYFLLRAQQGNGKLISVKYMTPQLLNTLSLSEPTQQRRCVLKFIEFMLFYRMVRGLFIVTMACLTTAEQSGFAELQMWRGLGLRLHATSHWHCSRAALTLVRAWLRGGLWAGRRKMYVKIMCLQEALYKAIKLSVSKTVHRGCNLCLWQAKIHFSCLLHCEL